MKNKKIKNINLLGKIGKILSIITLIISALGLVACIAGFTALGIIPDNAINADIAGNGTVTVNSDENGKLTVRTENTNGIRINSDEDFSTNTFANVNIDRKFGNMDVNIQFLKNEEKSSDTAEIYDLDVKINGDGGKSVADVLNYLLIIGCAISIFMSVAVFFACRLCKSLEKCDSPFEENVTRKMKTFAISLIPWGLACIYAGGLSAIGIAFLIVIVFLVFTIFGYGAQLQQESDETL